jgi:ABC-2 type transport system permease protein
MTTLSYSLADSGTMLRRNLLHALRYPSMTLFGIMMPVLLMLMFVYVFGGAIGGGIGLSAHGGYINYIAPGMILLTAASGGVATAVAVCSDMAEGIVARFRTMSISRGSMLTGHVVGSMIQTFVNIAVVTGVALLMGFRPSAGVLEWLGAVGILALLVFALTWLSVALGLVAKNVESASNLPMPLQFLPFIGSAIVPTNSMPGPVRWFAEYQPFTPTTEAIRGLLMGDPIGNDALIGCAWCVGIALIGYFWARKLFGRDPSR